MPLKEGCLFASDYSRSVLMVILGGVFLSFLGLGDRSLEAATGPQIAFYRALSQFIFFTFVFLILRKGSIADEFNSLTWRGWFAAVVMALAGFFLIMSFQFTLVANAIFFVSLTPLVAAILGWVFLKEAISQRTAIAMAVALIGVTIIFGTNMNGDGVIGMGFAFMMAVCYAGTIVIMRTIPAANVILICTLNAMFTLILMLPLIGDAKGFIHLPCARYIPSRTRYHVCHGWRALCSCRAGLYSGLARSCPRPNMGLDIRP